MEKGGIIKHDLNKSPKTGNWRYVRPEVDASKCIGCTTCVLPCPDASIEMRRRSKEEKKISPKLAQEKEIADIDYEYCKGCGVCAQVCPMKAIVMKK
ncbi:MAG: 4Fe-4S binding protein [Candidatus Moranbacteria bacterium]|nr:4Fe-4S binding protein [Candidatus Moranbacteria bacterium]